MFIRKPVKFIGGVGRLLCDTPQEKLEAMQLASSKIIKSIRHGHIKFELW